MNLSSIASSVKQASGEIRQREVSHAYHDLDCALLAVGGGGYYMGPGVGYYSGGGLDNVLIIMLHYLLFGRSLTRL